MTKNITRIVALTLATCALLAVSAGPAAAGGGPRPARAAGPQTLLQAAATYIGVTQAEIRTAKASGQTLAQLAVAKGKTAAGLTAALVTAGTADIDAKLAAGRITADRAAALKAALPAKVTALINGTGGCAGKTAPTARLARR